MHLIIKILSAWFNSTANQIDAEVEPDPTNPRQIFIKTVVQALKEQILKDIRYTCQDSSTPIRFQLRYISVSSQNTIATDELLRMNQKLPEPIRTDNLKGRITQLDEARYLDLNKFFGLIVEADADVVADPDVVKLFALSASNVELNFTFHGDFITLAAPVENPLPTPKDALVSTPLKVLPSQLAVEVCYASGRSAHFLMLTHSPFMLGREPDGHGIDLQPDGVELNEVACVSRHHLLVNAGVDGVQLDSLGRYGSFIDGVAIKGTAYAQYGQWIFLGGDEQNAGTVSVRITSTTSMEAS